MKNNWSIKKAYIFFLCLYFLALPFGAMNIGSFGSLLKVFAIVPLGIGFLSIRNCNFRYLTNATKPLFLYFLYTVISAVSIIYSIDVGSSIQKASSFVQLFLLMLSTTCFTYDSNDVDTIKKILHWSSIVSSFVVLTFGSYYHGRLWLTGKINEDPNYFCLYLSYGVIYSLEMLISHREIKAKVIGGIELSIYLAICLLTGSRGGLLAIIVSSIAYIMFSSGRAITAKKVCLFIVIGAGLYFAINNMSNVLVSRYSIQDVLSNGGSGRMDLWLQGIDSFKRANLIEKLFGTGIASTIANFTQHAYREINVMHNMFIESLLEIGIIGFIVYVLMIASFIKLSIHLEDRFSFAVLVGMVVLSLSTSISAFKPYINIMMYIIICGLKDQQENYK